MVKQTETKSQASRHISLVNAITLNNSTISNFTLHPNTDPPICIQMAQPPILEALQGPNG